MSSPPIAHPHAATAEPVSGDQIRPGLQFRADWTLRPLFGFVLAGVAVAATIYGGLWFVAFISLGCAGAIREWHRLFSRRHFPVPALLTVIAMVAALLCQLYQSEWMLPPYAPLAILLLGGICNLVLAIARGQPPLAHAAGVLYIAFPGLSLLGVRQWPLHPVWLVVLTFLAIWATDTGALFSGRLIGGPRLAPRLSPNKTWAGSLGGIACAALVSAGVALFLHSGLLAAIAFGAILSVVGQAGDLFESMVKRRSGCKDSGGLIPGHGGVLDRIDSILFAAPAALAMLLAGFNPLAGGHP